jgi:hypothetical protein
MHGAKGEGGEILTSDNFTGQRFQLKGKLCLVRATLRKIGEEEGGGRREEGGERREEGGGKFV